MRRALDNAPELFVSTETEILPSGRTKFRLTGKVTGYKSG